MSWRAGWADFVHSSHRIGHLLVWLERRGTLVGGQVLLIEQHWVARLSTW